jgi:hypothetical protein
MKLKLMKSPFYVLALVTALSFVPCAAQTISSSANVSDGSSSSIDASDPDRIIATIRGSSGIANVQGDRVELKDRVVYVNARSFGAVPANCEIKYIVTKSARTLYVDGKPRTPPAAAR